MTKQEIQKEIQKLAKKELKKRGFDIGQHVKIIGQSTLYYIESVSFSDLNLNKISVKIRRPDGLDWCRPELRHIEKASQMADKEWQINDYNNS